MKSKKFLIWLIPVVAFAAFYIIGTLITANKFWGNTYLGEKQAGFKTVDELKTDLISTDSIVLTTLEGDTKSIKLTDIDYTSEYTTDIQSIKNEQSPMLWLFNIAGQKSYDVDIKTTYNEEKLNEAITSIVNELNSNATAPVDAYIDTSSDTPVIVEAVEGNTIDEAKLRETIIADLNSGVFAINLDEAGCYLKPTVYADNEELQLLVDKIIEIKDVSITLDLTDATETIDVNVFKNWLTTDGTSLAFNEDLVSAYVSELADKYDTYGTTRTFPATGYGLVTLSATARDTYGFSMDQSATAEAIKEAILSNESQTISAVWDYPGLVRNASNGSGDIGDTYVEIDVTRQHMWYYVDGSLYLDTDVRTGDESGKYEDAATPSGIFRILSKSTDKYFLLFEPVVHADYWMPFDWQGCGIHDASWYSTFGGELYKTSGGSHGCINTPLSIVEPMYQKITVNTPVIVYRSENF